MEAAVATAPEDRATVEVVSIRLRGLVGAALGAVVDLAAGTVVETAAATGEVKSEGWVEGSEAEVRRAAAASNRPPAPEGAGLAKRAVEATARVGSERAEAAGSAPGWEELKADSVAAAQTAVPVALAAVLAVAMVEEAMEALEGRAVASVASAAARAAVECSEAAAERAAR